MDNQKLVAFIWTKESEAIVTMICVANSIDDTVMDQSPRVAVLPMANTALGVGDGVCVALAVGETEALGGSVVFPHVEREQIKLTVRAIDIIFFIFFLRIPLISNKFKEEDGKQCFIGRI